MQYLGLSEITLQWKCTKFPSANFRDFCFSENIIQMIKQEE
jgi:hypothetical protein